MERERLRIEPIVFQRFSLCGADQTAFHSEFRINIKQNGQIRLEPSAGECVDAFEHIEIQSAGVSLIDHGRVEEAVGNNRDAFGEFRFQQAFDHLGVTGPEEQKFRFRSEVFGLLACFENRAELLSDFCSAGRPDRLHFPSGPFHGFREKPHLCGFPGSFAPFKCNKLASDHHFIPFPGLQNPYFSGKLLHEKREFNPETKISGKYQTGEQQKMASKLARDTYLTKHTGNFPQTIEIGGRTYVKADDLRYGTNPHQPAAFYRPEGLAGSIMDMKTLKNGKNGLSQTNLEDISGALNIVKYFDRPACAVMKHVNPSGAAVQMGCESLCDVYLKARDCDARAAFGSVIAFNVEVDAETAAKIMSTFVECVVAPAFSAEALAIFNDSEHYKLNKQIRILQCGPLSTLPRYVGDDPEGTHNTIKVLGDGSLVVAAPLLTFVKGWKDLPPASGESKTAGIQVSTTEPTEAQKCDLLAAWYINISVRSNGVVIVKDGQTLAVGTGEQDRVGAVEQAIEKFKQKYTGSATLEGAVMSSDGFFPFADGLEVAAAAGIKAMVAPSGSLKDADVIKRANELGVALRHAPERIFSHH